MISLQRLPVYLPATMLVLAFSCQHNVRGSTVPPAPEPADPPDRVARLSYIQGSVSLRPAGSDDWVEAQLNRPLTSGDMLWTESESRAELHTGDSAIRLGARTSIELMELSDHAMQVKLTEGSVVVRVRRLEEKDELEIDAPQSAITILRTGEYRVDVYPAQNETRVMARGGSAEVSGTAQSVVVHAGQQARFLGGERPSYEVTPASAADALDEFSRSRDGREDRSASSQANAPRDMIGYEDLDEHGAWHTHPEWGPVWAPRVIAPGWAPYRFGRWVWIEPWGWTWVDDAPWGFAPFHYGRWVYVDWGWCWVPPPLRIRPVYAPALVVFVGGGRAGFRFHLWVGFGGVAWFPLGPREVYVPPYRASRNYITNINIRNTIIQDHHRIHDADISRQHYRNQRIAGAITAVPPDAFRDGRAVYRAAVNVSARDADAARVRGTAPPVAPGPRSLGDGGAARRPPDATAKRGVIARRTAPPAPGSFEQKRPRLDRDPGRPGPALGDEARGRASRPEVRQIPKEPRQRPQARQPQTAQPSPAPERRAGPAREPSREQERRARQIESERQKEQRQPRQEGRRSDRERRRGN